MESDLDNFLGTLTEVEKKQRAQLPQARMSDASFKPGSRFSGQPRWEKQMNENYQRSMMDSGQKVRDCCSLNASMFQRHQTCLNKLPNDKEKYNNEWPHKARGKSAGVSRAQQQQMRLLAKREQMFSGLKSETNLETLEEIDVPKKHNPTACGVLGNLKSKFN